MRREISRAARALIMWIGQALCQILGSRRSIVPSLHARLRGPPALHRADGILSTASQDTVGFEPTMETGVSFCYARDPSTHHSGRLAFCLTLRALRFILIVLSLPCSYFSMTCLYFPRLCSYFHSRCSHFLLPHLYVASPCSYFPSHCSQLPHLARPH